MRSKHGFRCTCSLGALPMHCNPGASECVETASKYLACYVLFTTVHTHASL